MDEFDLAAYHELNIEFQHTEEGWVQVNSLRVEEKNWRGDYYQGVPITVIAKAKPAHVFSHWEGDIDSTEDSLQIDMVSAMNLIPVFEPTAESVIHINEINYNAADDFKTGDWVELYNASDVDFDLSGWIMKDDDDTHSFIFPQGTIIEADGYLVLTRDQERFESEVSNSGLLVGDFDFGLSKKGDAVRLYNAEEVLVDEVHYLPNAPWPTLADGQGYTLELISPDLDNSLPESWASINAQGSPFKVNIGNDPINNKIFGADVAYSREAPFLTRMVDAIPLISTKEASSINVTAEAAYLRPGHARGINENSGKEKSPEIVF